MIAEAERGQIIERISIAGIDPLSLYGHHDAHLFAIQQELGVEVMARGEEVILRGEGPAVGRAADLVKELVILIQQGFGFDEMDFKSALEYAGQGDPPYAPQRDGIVSTKKGVIRPRSTGQYIYTQAIRKYDIVFGIGPAGTGKTYLAVATAASALKEREVSRIILSRPAVEAGESLGFLPGDLSDKIDPYLRPLYDALDDMIPSERLRTFSEVRTIEVIPLAYMRGRTLSNAFVILDEAQNTTTMQMKMFLTRLGMGSKAVITGDITQVDLPQKKASGLIQIQRILSDVRGIKFVYLTERDVVRHRLVREIIKAYDLYAEQEEHG